MDICRVGVEFLEHRHPPITCSSIRRRSQPDLVRLRVAREPDRAQVRRTGWIESKAAPSNEGGYGAALDLQRTDRMPSRHLVLYRRWILAGGSRLFAKGKKQTESWRTTTTWDFWKGS
jgi:hypothetical protein